MEQTEYSEQEVREIVQTTYSKFAELWISQHTTASLRHIIEVEVEQLPSNSIKIFTPKGGEREMEID